MSSNRADAVNRLLIILYDNTIQKASFIALYDKLSPCANSPEATLGTNPITKSMENYL